MGNSCTNRSSVRIQVNRQENHTECLEPTDLSRSCDIYKYRTDLIKIDDLSRFNLDITCLELNYLTHKTIKWKKGEFIGEGEYSKVYQCMNIETGELLAVKHFQISHDHRLSEKEFNNMKTEVQLLRELQHPNVVTYYQTDLPTDYSGIYVLLEYVPGGSLKRLISKYGHLEESIVKTYIKQLLEGLKYLHSHEVIHRDLKCANVLVSSDGKIKLTDFGSSVKLTSCDKELSKSIQGSPCFIAPEVLLRQSHSYSADIWSLGCMIIEMLTGEAPWSNFSKDEKQLFKLITHTKIRPNMPLCSVILKDVITQCLQRNPLQRPTAKQLLEHKFFESKEEAIEVSMNGSQISTTRDLISKFSSDSLSEIYRRN